MKDRRIRVESLQFFNHGFECGIGTLPRNVGVIAWSPISETWYAGPEYLMEDRFFKTRVPNLIRFLDTFVLPRVDPLPLWLLVAFYDGWRERIPFSENYHWIDPGDLSKAMEWRGPPGSIPILAEKRRWLACYCAHFGDPSSLLMPEAHYLSLNFYADLFREVERKDVPWEQKKARAILCAGNHGETSNYFPPVVEDRPHVRQYLRQMTQASALPLEVRLGEQADRVDQLAYKLLVDADGYSRTYDAWAWKMKSNSTVVSVSSPWETFFTRQFEPWVHFVPVANDLSDLAAKLDWCLANDSECREIAERGRRRAEEVYEPAAAAVRCAEELSARIFDESTAFPLLEPPGDGLQDPP